MCPLQNSYNLISNETQFNLFFIFSVFQFKNVQFNFIDSIHLINEHWINEIITSPPQIQ